MQATLCWVEERWNDGSDLIPPLCSPPRRRRRRVPRPPRCVLGPPTPGAGRPSTISNVHHTLVVPHAQHPIPPQPLHRRIPHRRPPRIPLYIPQYTARSALRTASSVALPFLPPSPSPAPAARPPNLGPRVVAFPATTLPSLVSTLYIPLPTTVSHCSGTTSPSFHTALARVIAVAVVAASSLNTASPAAAANHTS